MQPDEEPKQPSPKPASPAPSKESSHSTERERSKDRSRSKESDRPKERERSKDRERDRSHERGRDHDHSRARDRSADRDRKKSPPHRGRDSSLSYEEEPEGWEKKEEVFLDTYNSDLSLIINADGCSAKPLTHSGFSLMWAGVRATYGLNKGKAFFEAKLTKEISVENLDSMVGGSTHVMRVGWSTEEAGLALGEEPLSYGFGGTGKKSTDGKFEDYGCKFGEGDVVGAFVEVTSSDAIMSFSVNGVDQGECFKIPLSSLGKDAALFPHIYVKNVEFSVNFGQGSQEPWFPAAKGNNYHCYSQRFVI